MIVSRYITKEILVTLLAVTTILLLAFLSQQIVRYLNYAAIGKIPTDILLQLVSFEIPYVLSFLLPLGLYLGILLTYGRLYADNEMAILQMYGYGSLRLFRLGLGIALVVAGMVLFLNLYVNPLVSAKRQQLMASDQATLHLVQTLVPGRFQASPDGKHVLYVERLSLDRKRAENVFLAKNEGNAWSLVIASSGYQEQDAHSGPYFVTENGYRYDGLPGQNDYKLIQFKKYLVRIPQAEVKMGNQENEALTMQQLWQDYHLPKRAAEFQWRFSAGLSAILLAMLAIPLSMAGPRQGRYLSLLPAVLVYIVYIQLLYIARHWVAQGSLAVGIGLWAVHGLMLVFIALVFWLRPKIFTGQR